MYFKPFKLSTVVVSALCVLAGVSGGSAEAQALKFINIGSKKDASKVLNNCPLVEGVNKIKIINGGKAVELQTLKNRDSYSFPVKYKQFACADAGGGNFVLYAKTSPNSEAVIFDLALTDFPKVESNVGSACSSIKSWPGSHIYKTVGSHHFTDIRRNTIGLILKIGAGGPYPGCVEAIDTKGNVVAKLGLYSKGAGWAARYYAGIGCGSRTPFNGGAVTAKARKNTGSSKIYMDFGSTCYGPIEASRCVGSKAC